MTALAVLKFASPEVAVDGRIHTFSGQGGLAGISTSNYGLQHRLNACPAHTCPLLAGKTQLGFLVYAKEKYGNNFIINEKGINRKPVIFIPNIKISYFR
jgi:hypothetical protein